MRYMKFRTIWRRLNLVLALMCLFVLESRAGEPLSSGIDQLVVIKPGTHERGLPAVRFEPAESDGKMLVDIPPTLHVHRFYYDGDREYQGPVVLGGPTTVVANHPKTGERIYVDVTLPQGTPIISYCSKAITYVYPDRRVQIRFGNWHPNKVKIDYVSGKGVARTTRNVVGHISSHTAEGLKKSAAMQSLADATCGTKEAMVGFASAVDTGVANVVDGTCNFLKGLPIISSLPNLGSDAPQAGYEAELRGLSRKKEGSSLDFIRTNR